MLAAGATLGPYKIVGPLGAGGMGEVYRAHDSRLGRDVAIKVLPQHLAATPEVRARFEREARTISQLNHPHICTLYDVGRAPGEAGSDGTDYLVMELLEGETLAHRIGKGALPVAEVLTLGRQIAEALDRAHRAGVVHRDLKPVNVMLTKGGAKLMDFGLARAHGMAAAASAMSQSPTVSRPLTAEGTIVGTFQYMAPEQLEGREADARSDLWALGCVLYEMATGARAFEGGTQASLISAIMRDEPRAMTELRPVTPPALERVVRRCLAKDPDDRFQNARDLAFDLEGVGGSGPTVAVPNHSSTSGRRFGLTAVAAVAALAVVLTAAVAIVVVRLAAPTDAAKLTFTPLTVQRGIISGARFEPDDQSILYSAAWDGKPPEVFETRVGVPVGRPLGVVGAKVLSASHVGMATVLLDQPRVVTTWGTVAEVPVTGGAPRRLHSDVWTADWNTAAKTLAIVRRAGATSRLEMPPGRLLYEGGGGLGYVRVSNTGRWVAIVSNPVPHDTRGSVAIVDTTGRIVGRTREEWNYVGGIAWRANDREVWFCASGDAATTEIRALSVSGAERVIARLPGLFLFEDMNRNGDVLVVSEPGHCGIRGLASPARAEVELGWFDTPIVADISGDGRQLLFYETGIFGGNLYATCLRSMDGAPPVKLGEGLACALSPDGAWALAIQLLQPHRLVRLPTGAGDSASFPRGAVERYEGAGWLPDGKGIVFSGSEAGRGRRTYVQDVVGGLPRPVSPEGIAGWHVSPDGRFVAALGADQRLYACPMNGDSGRVVAQLEPEEQVLRWARDGQAVYVQRPGVELRVSRITIATGERIVWRTYGLPDPAGANIAMSAITADGGAYAYTYAKILTVLNLVTGLK